WFCVALIVAEEGEVAQHAIDEAAVLPIVAGMGAGAAAEARKDIGAAVLAVAAIEQLALMIGEQRIEAGIEAAPIDRRESARSHRSAIAEVIVDPCGDGDVLRGAAERTGIGRRLAGVAGIGRVRRLDPAGPIRREAVLDARARDKS